MSAYHSALQSYMNRLWDLVAQYGFDTLMSLKYISCLLDIKHLDWKRKRESIHPERAWEEEGYLSQKRIRQIKYGEELDYFLSIRDKELILCPQDIESSRLTSDLLSKSISLVNSIYEEMERRYLNGESSSEAMEGYLYEQLLNHTVELGKRGQFRTPRHIVKLMVGLVRPQEGEVILDPVCGTGGFLLNACQYILKEKLKGEDSSFIEQDADGFETIASDRLPRDRKFSVRGFDNDDTMVKLARLNFRMHGIEGAKIEQKDILGGMERVMNPEDFWCPVEKPEPAADIILANPPFGVRVKNWQTQRMEASEALFLKQIVSFLRPEGRAAVVVPEGMVFNKTFKEIRRELVERNRLDAVISLPAGVFQPYTQGKSTIFVFTKQKPSNEDYSIWFYELESDGYSLDNNRRRLKNFPLTELLDVYEKKGTVSEEAKKGAFYVGSKEIRANDFDLSYNLYKENEYVKQVVEKPREILDQLMTLEEEVYQKMQELDSYFREKWEM